MSEKFDNPKLNLLRTLVNDYIKFLTKVRKLSLLTIKAYRDDLNWFIEKIHIFYKNNNAFPALSQNFMRFLVLNMKKNNLSSRSISRKLSSIRNFFNWVLKNNVDELRNELQSNPMLNVKGPRLLSLLPKALTVDETINFLDSKKKQMKSWIDFRDDAIFELIYSSGLRVSEVAKIDIKKTKNSFGWIDFDSSQIEIMGKGSHWRIIPIGNFAIKSVKVWIKYREILAEHKSLTSNQAALFLNNKGMRISVRTIQRRFEIHSRNTKSNLSVSPHMLRHSFASHILQSSGNLRAIQELLGHSKISTTQIYTRLDHQHLSKIYDKTHPRAKLNS